MKPYDVIILGAGGAGMMCALHAGRRGRKTALLDHADKAGKKILISGGGRCNFTNLGAGPENYLSQNPHFCKSALARYTPRDFMDMVENHGVAYHEKKLGQLFCRESAQGIVDILETECRRAGVDFYLNCKIKTVRKDGRFHVTTGAGEFTADSLVVATGGLSIPKIGSTGFGYDLARQFGLNVVEPAPALDGFIPDPILGEKLRDLSGIAVDSIVECGGKKFRENTLFTHKGLSGPAILQASLYWKPGAVVVIHPFPDLDLWEWLSQKRREGAKAEIKTLLADLLPKRLAETLCELHNAPASLLEAPEKKLRAFCSAVQNWEIRPTTTVGYAKAEVTRGGVDTNELSSKTMEARKIPGLFFIGEVVDVTGELGGYNFQWAWASGVAAGQAV